MINNQSNQWFYLKTTSVHTLVRSHSIRIKKTSYQSYKLQDLNTHSYALLSYIKVF